MSYATVLLSCMKWHGRYPKAMVEIWIALSTGHLAVNNTSLKSQDIFWYEHVAQLAEIATKNVKTVLD